MGGCRQPPSHPGCSPVPPLPAEAQRRPYYADFSHTRRSIHSLCTSHYLDLFITFIIGLNVITMSMEHYNQPKVVPQPVRQRAGLGVGLISTSMGKPGRASPLFQQSL
jgi:hypothetical protein